MAIKRQQWEFVEELLGVIERGELVPAGGVSTEAWELHLSERPRSVEARRHIGHWEIDTVMGTGPECLVSLVERKTASSRIDN